MLKYCIELTDAVSSTRQCVREVWAKPPEGGHAVVPGQWVMIKNHVAGPLEEKRKGPFQVLLITDAAVLCQGCKMLYNASHCKIVPPP